MMDDQLAAWAALWGVPELTCRVEFSARLSASLGRCLLQRKVIRLHPALADRWAEHLPEALCHEFAHLAAEELHPARWWWRSARPTLGKPIEPSRDKDRLSLDLKDGCYAEATRTAWEGTDGQLIERWRQGLTPPQLWRQPQSASESEG